MSDATVLTLLFIVATIGFTFGYMARGRATFMVFTPDEDDDE